jgi:hypothetical protein
MKCIAEDSAFGETRNPKPEIRMNAQNQSSTLRLRPEGKPKVVTLREFGFRVSDFILISGFGFLVSRLRCTIPPIHEYHRPSP